MRELDKIKEELLDSIKNALKYEKECYVSPFLEKAYDVGVKSRDVHVILDEIREEISNTSFVTDDVKADMYAILDIYENSQN